MNRSFSSHSRTRGKCICHEMVIFKSPAYNLNQNIRHISWPNSSRFNLRKQNIACTCIAQWFNMTAGGHNLSTVLLELSISCCFSSCLSVMHYLGVNNVPASPQAVVRELRGYLLPLRAEDSGHVSSLPNYHAWQALRWRCRCLVYTLRYSASQHIFTIHSQRAHSLNNTWHPPLHHEHTHNPLLSVTFTNAPGTSQQCDSKHRLCCLSLSNIGRCWYDDMIEQWY